MKKIFSEHNLINFIYAQIMSIIFICGMYWAGITP